MDSSAEGIAGRDFLQSLKPTFGHWRRALLAIGAEVY
jgi:hypothetical protein